MGRTTTESMSPSAQASGSLRKRSHDDLELDVQQPTPSKRRRSSAAEAQRDIDTADSATKDIEMRAGNDGLATTTEIQNVPLPQPPNSTPRKRGRPRKHPVTGETPTPKAQRTVAPETPSKGNNDDGDMPGIQAAAGGADRSARRKSARAIIEQAIGDEVSDDDDDNEGLAREIYESGESDGDNETEGGATTANEDDQTDKAPDTPSKAAPKKTRKKRAKSPTPPRDLPPHELYFAQNKPGRPKTSNNTLASFELLTHDEYFSILQEQNHPHREDKEYLESLHAESFPQWAFELAQGFSLCLYGFGSKRSLLQRFARHLHDIHPARGSKKHKIVIVNGYSPTTTMRDVLTTIGLAIDQRIPAGPPTTMVKTLLSHLTSLPDRTLTIIVNSIDAAPLRKPTHQSTLSQLASHPQIRLVCSADTPDFPLLWDIGQRSAFAFAFHDATTFAHFSVELDIVDDVHELLGRKAHRVNGREGVAFVLRSLPENARNLFQLLVGEVLIAMDNDDEAGGGGAGAEEVGVEYRMVYNKAVEEFICSSEMAFRTLLKEFHDHQIITSRKDALGTEQLSVPFRREELEAILEDLMG